MTQPDPVLQTLLGERVARMLPRWDAEIERADHGLLRISLDHPYSDGLVFVSQPELAAADLTEQIHWMEQCLHDDGLRWEAAVIIDAPDPARHPQSVLGLRRHAELFAWSAIEVRCVAGMLGDGGALTPAEYDWVTRKVGEDAPDVAGTNPMVMRWRWRTPSEPFGPRDARRTIVVPGHS